MWKPANVVPEHKKRATVVWGILLLAIVGYTAWQITTLVRKSDNPSTNFSVSDDVYEFPRLDVCVWGGKGCDEKVDDTACIGTAGFTVYDPCFNETLGANTTSEWNNCLAFDLSVVDMKGFEDGCEPSKKPSVTVSITWITSDAPDEEEYFRDVVGVFLGSESPPEYVMVPYTRVVKSAGVPLDDITYIEADMTIGKSTRNYIDGDSITSYPVLSVSTSDLVDQTPDDPAGSISSSSSYAVGYLRLTLTQGGYSLTELTDIDPLDIGTLLGNIGGFWELLLVTWGLCFIAATTESPTQKGRDFTQPIKKGQDIVTRKRRRSSSQTTSPDSDGGAEEQPYWNTSGRSAQEASGSSFRAIPPVGARPPVVVAASSFRRPIQQDYPTRSVSNSARSLVTGKSFMASGGEGSAITQDQPPTYSDCA